MDVDDLAADEQKKTTKRGFRLGDFPRFLERLLHDVAIKPGQQPHVSRRIVTAWKAGKTVDVLTVGEGRVVRGVFSVTDGNQENAIAEPAHAAEFDLVENDSARSIECATHGSGLCPKIDETHRDRTRSVNAADQNALDVRGSARTGDHHGILFGKAT